MAAADQDNPLLNVSFQIPFDRIDPSHVRPAIETLLARTRGRLDAIVDDTPRTYASTFGALDDATRELDVAMTVVGHLESVASTPEIREAYNAVKPDVSAFYASIPHDRPLYEALKSFASTEEAAGLTGPRRRFVDKTLDEFKRHGAELDPADKERLSAISRELAELTARYGQNLLDSTAAFELVVDDSARLAGLPESARAAARQSAAQKGVEGFRFTLQAPSLIPVLTYLDDRALREKVYRAYNQRATEPERDNPALIRSIIRLRQQKARLLGYATFADLVLEDRMAKSAASARRFVSDLEARARSAFDRERAELEAFVQRTAGPEALPLRPWDIAYYAEKQRRARFDFDEEALRPYFPLSAVLTGVFETAQRLYGVTIVRNDTLATWRESVEVYDLRDRGGEFLGSFYVDAYPREEKRGGAWMNGLVSGVVRAGRLTPHLGLMCANVTPPVDGRPALLTHSEVETLFHEFGHLLHHLLSRVEVRAFAGTNVAWDFVELPSQIMENWCWEREALDTFARHYETDEPIPEAMFDKMKRARTYRAATAMMRQLGFATVDLLLHTEFDPDEDASVVAYARQILERFAPAEYFDGYAFIAGFGHLFSSEVGYAAGYYSYKWAEVLDADAFTRFAQEGIFSAEVGDAFRRSILEPGDGVDPAELYRRFMGREPDLTALLARAGLS